MQNGEFKRNVYNGVIKGVGVRRPTLTWRKSTEGENGERMDGMLWEGGI